MSAGDVTRLLRPDLLAMEGYEPIEPTDVLAEALGIPPERVVKLDGNENPYGPSPRALAALADACSYHIYPDPQQRKVRRALAAYLGVDEELVVAGSGSDELIDLVLRATLSVPARGGSASSAQGGFASGEGGGDGVIDCPPTFGMYSFSTLVCGGRLMEVPRREDFSLDLAGIEDAVGRRAKVIFVASPNNPTGNAVTPREVETLLDLGLLVVVDEAYVEFGGESLVSRVLERERLVVLRTFSKWAGLAGLRAGYGVFPPVLASLLLRIKPPYNLNVAAQVAALASLEDLELLRERVAALVRERERLYRKLGRIPFLRPYPSQANFLLCRVEGLEARWVRDRLAERGIFVRHFDTPLLRAYLRISVGLPEHTDALLRALEELPDTSVGAELKLGPGQS
jgi:histidinol-phosphate aminotransferase